MPLLRKGVIMPVQGIDFSQPATFIDDRAGFPVNMRYYRNELRKRPGKSVLNEQIEDQTQIMGLGKLELSSGSKRLIRNSKTKLEFLNTSTDTWDSIATTDFGGGDDDFFFYTNVTENDLIIIANGYDRLRKWTGSGNNSLLLGNPPIAKYCAYLQPYTLIAHLNELGDILPWAVDWCDTNDPENWSSGNSGRALLSDEPSPIQNILKLNEFVAAYKKESLYLGRKVDTADIFSFDCIKTGIGLGAPRAVVDAEGRHYFMGQNDFYVWNGIREESIGRPVRDEVFSRINRQSIGRCFAIHVQELQEIWFFIIITGYEWPTEVWKYNYGNNFWYQDTCDLLTAAIKWERINSVTWDSASGTWDAAQGVWDNSTTVAAWEDIVFGTNDGYCQSLDYSTTNDNGEAVDAYFVTKDFVGDLLEFNKRWLQFDVWAKGPGKLYVDYSTDEGSSWTNLMFTSSTAYADLDSTYTKYRFYLDVWSEKIRFRLRNGILNETFYLRSLYPYYLAREEIR